MSWIAQLPFFLTWELNHDLLEKVKANYLHMLDVSFWTWLGGCENDDYAERLVCKEIYSNLAPASRWRFLSNPEISGALLQLSGHSQTSHFFYNCLLAESLSYLKEEPNVLEVRLLLRNAEMGNIIIDAIGSFCPPSLASFDTYSNKDEIAFVARRVAGAMNSAGLVNEYVLYVLEQILKVIVIRKDRVDVKGFSSSSWTNQIGKIALINAHQLDRNDGWIMDALVHESIHSLLYMIECFEPFCPSNAIASVAYKVVSPWSGKALCLHSYLHACFVWFGLWCFWSLATESGEFPKALTDIFRERSRQGFLGYSLLACLDQVQDQITEPVKVSIKTLQEIVICS